MADTLNVSSMTWIATSAVGTLNVSTMIGVTSFQKKDGVRQSETLVMGTVRDTWSFEFATPPVVRYDALKHIAPG